MSSEDSSLDKTPEQQILVGSAWSRNNLPKIVPQTGTVGPSTPPTPPYPLDDVQPFVVPLRRRGEKQLPAMENSTVSLPATTTGLEALPSPPSSPTFAGVVERLMSTSNDHVAYSREGNDATPRPVFDPWNRALLVAWLLKACEEFKCSRETFHLAIDFMDRYVAIKFLDEHSDLEMIAAASWLLAMKMETSLFPRLPDIMEKVKQISVCVDDIFHWEKEVLRTLNFRLNPVTSIQWLGLFLQKAQMTMTSTAFFMDTAFSKLAFINVARLIDLCLMNTHSIKFDYKIMTASALFHFTNAMFISDVTDLSMRQLGPCIKWMVPMAEAIQRLAPCQLQDSPRDAEEFHVRQTCSFGMEVVLRLLGQDVTRTNEDPSAEDLFPKLSDYLGSEFVKEFDVTPMNDTPVQSLTEVSGNVAISKKRSGQDFRCTGTAPKQRKKK